MVDLTYENLIDAQLNYCFAPRAKTALLLHFPKQVQVSTAISVYLDAMSRVVLYWLKLD